MAQYFDERYAQLYDTFMLTRDWPGEVEFYLSLAAKAMSNGLGVLEVACGTGRIAVKLAQAGVKVTGLDLSRPMLEVAEKKSRGMPNVRWVHGDMKSFDLHECFGLVIIPGHSFQNMLTPADQVECLESIKRHLAPGGLLVVHLDHQDVTWLASLVKDKGGVFERGQDLVHPQTGRLIRSFHAWTFSPSSQTATIRAKWEEVDADGNVVDHWESVPNPMHCVFRFEMEHLLARVGFDTQAVYGDFIQHELGDDSTDMIWVAKRPVRDEDSHAN